MTFRSRPATVSLWTVASGPWMTACGADPSNAPERSPDVGAVISEIRCQSEWDCLIQNAGARCVPDGSGIRQCVECLNDFDCAALGFFGSVCRNERCAEETECTPQPERCDGLDNDCDGRVDDGLSNACGGACDSSLQAQPGEACRVGTSSCSIAGTYVCSGTNAVRCESKCTWLCQLRDGSAVRTQNPCNFASSDSACVPEGNDC